ncbi:MAG: hypothetical protein JW717_07085 [Marinilabiliaceae bacterium]|nr:hypothetical protein [Marinilabiliaceae bacterium]
MSNSRDKKWAESIVEDWIELYEPISRQKVSPFFKDQVLSRIELLREPVEKISFFERAFLKIAVAIVFVLVVFNVSMINKVWLPDAKNESLVEEMVNSYKDIDADTYNNYSMLAFDNK